MAHYMFLSNTHSSLHHPGNTPGDFIVRLPKSFTLQGHWECALVEVSIPLPYHQRLYICSDIIQDSVVGNTLYPVLRSIPEVDDDDRSRIGMDIAIETAPVHFVFERPYFFPLRKKDLEDVRIFITGSDFLPVTPLNGTVHCTLLIRRKLDQ